MTVHLDWPPEIVERLTEEARQRGLALDVYVLETVLRASGAARRRAEAAARIREISKGNVLGPDLTIRDLIEEGRRS